MKKSEKILKAIEENKELQSNFKKLYSFTNEEFIMNAERYIKAIKDGRMLCVIQSVSNSGMSRVLKFAECSKGRERHNFLNFNALFVALGYSRVKNSDGFRVNGCGMDMVFHTNYSIIHNLHRLGFINKEQCNHLAQQTPAVI